MLLSLHDEVCANAGHTADELLARSSLHASNTIALGSLPAGEYQLTFPCAPAGSCNPQPAALLFWIAAAHVPSQQALVHVLRPVLQVTSAVDNSRRQTVTRGWKRRMHGCLALLLLGLQGLSSMHA